MENTWTQLGLDIDGEAAHDYSGYSISLSADGTVLAIGAPYNTGAPLSTGITGSVRVYKWISNAWTKRGDDIDGTDLNDNSQFGNVVSLNADGTILAVGAPATNSNSGYVNVYTWNGITWSQLGLTIYGYYLKKKGWYLSLSADGTILAIGQINSSLNSITNSGDVTVYTWNGSTWTQLGGSILGKAAFDQFGFSVALSSDGTIVAGSSSDNANGTGYVGVYKYISGDWSQLGDDIAGEAENDYSGTSISLSADGTILAIGSPYNAGSGNYPGSVRVYEWDAIDEVWNKIGLDIDGGAADDAFGYMVSLSADGTILAVGSPWNADFTGRATIHKWNGTAWTQLGGDIVGEALSDEYGTALSLNANGTVLAIGAVRNTGVNGSNSGSVRVYKWNGVSYYPTETDALSDTNMLGIGPSYVVGDGGPFGPGSGYTSWKIASNSTGPSAQNVVYVNGDALDASGSYNLYPSIPCFLEGTKILCKVDGVEKYVPVEQLNKGTQVKTSIDGYKRVVLIGKGSIHNPGHNERTKNRLYKCSTSKYPELKEDLYITGCHSIIEYPITEKEKEETIKHLGELFVTDKKYRLMAFLDERAEPWNSKGEYTIWHFALENEDVRKNYGVYANGGLLVETCSINFLRNKSNMVCK